jgi:hypothetical protein
MTSLLIAAVALIAVVAVWRLWRASRKVDAILRDYNTPTPAPTAIPAPKENPAA